jgi:hypothetical protein
MLHALTLLIGIATLPAALQPAFGDARQDVPVALRGIAHRRTITFAGGELRPKAAATRDAPVQLLITRGGAKDSWLIEVLGFVPGVYDLSEWIELADGSAARLAPIPVQFVSTLPPGLHLELEAAPLPPVGLTAWPVWLWSLLGLLWVAAPVVWLAWWWRRRLRSREMAVAPDAAAPDAFRDLIAALERRGLSTAEKGQLEMLVVRELSTRPAPGSWHGARRNPYLAARLDPSAATLVDSIEAWLHHPNPPADADRQALEALRSFAASRQDASLPAESAT